MRLFSLHFVKTGVFSVEVGRYLREAFELRQMSDYEEFIYPSTEQVSESIANAEKFIAEAEMVWHEIRGKLREK